MKNLAVYGVIGSVLLLVANIMDIIGIIDFIPDNIEIIGVSTVIYNFVALIYDIALIAFFVHLTKENIINC